MNVLGMSVAAAQELRFHASRTCLTMLSLIVATAVLTIVTAAGDISARSTQAFLEEYLGRPATLQVTLTGSDSSEHLRQWLGERLSRYGLSSASPFETRELEVSRPQLGAVKITAYGVAPELAMVRRLRLTDGRWMTGKDELLLAPVVVVNDRLARTLDLNDLAAGASVTIGGAAPVRAAVVGSLRSDPTSDQQALYMPVDVLDRWWPEESTKESAAGYLVRVAPAFLVELSSVLKRDTSSLPGWRIEIERADTTRAIGGVIDQQRRVLQIVAAVAFVTGALGLVNVNLVVLRSRAREFAIRRAFGASRSDVYAIVVFESMITAVIAGALGVIVALSVVERLPSLIVGSLPAGDSSAFPVGAMTTGLLVASAVGFFASILPARRAASMAISDVIR